jgi:hypothetical protein
MLPNVLVITFNNGSVCEIELIQNQLVELWYDSFTKNKHIEFYNRSYDPTLHSKVLKNSFPEAVQKINDAIKTVEQLTEVPWNIRAFDGMSFETTNKIHRMFTTSVTTNCRNNDISVDLKNFFAKQKQEAYISHKKIANMIDIWSKENKIYNYSDNARGEIDYSLQVINAWIHLYEVECMYSPRTEHINQISNVLAADLDLKRIDGSYLVSKPAEPIIDTDFIPLCHSNDSANVYALKKILGKDYLTCYYDHDNPLEWDVTMANTIDGSFVIDYEGIYEYTYNTEEFKYWIRDHKLKDKHTYSNIQIGRVTNGWCEEFKAYAHQNEKQKPIRIVRSPLEVQKESELEQMEHCWNISNIREVFI